MPHIYLDTNFFVELCEGDGTSSQAARSVMELGESQKAKLISSELSLAEALVEPLKDMKWTSIVRPDDSHGLKLTPGTLSTIYLELISDGHGLSVAAIDRSTLILSAHYRAETPSLRLPDAIHLATAQQAGCEVVISGDKRLRPTSAYRFRRVAVTPQELVDLVGEVT